MIDQVSESACDIMHVYVYIIHTCACVYIINSIIAYNYNNITIATKIYNQAIIIYWISIDDHG